MIAHRREMLRLIERAHPGLPYTVPESRLMQWIGDEADRLVDQDDYSTTGEAYDDREDRALLAALRARGHDAQADALEAELDERRREAGELEHIRLEVPDRIDSHRWVVEDINRALRSLWDHVVLGADLMPVRAEWRVEEWRRSD